MRFGFVAVVASLAALTPSFEPAGFGKPRDRAVGKIVVANDEWTLSNTGFTAPSDSARFAVNVASFFTGGSPGSFLVYSSNFGLTQSSLRVAMEGAGHTWTVNSSLPFTLNTLLNYDAVFVCGSGAVGASSQVLIAYVNAGGCVYVAGGTGELIEPTMWNPFLNTFGLSFPTANSNNITGQIAINSTHPLMAGVDTLYQASGSTVADLDAASSSNLVIATHTSGQGLYAVFAPPSCPADLNGDGLVNTADLVRFLGRFGQPTTVGGEGDFNSDGAVNTADLVFFLGRFGVPC